MSDPLIPIKRPSVPIPGFIAQSDVPQPKQESKYPTEMVPLPTRGFFYPEGHPLASGEVEIKQMTAREEDILANQDLIKKGKVLDRLLESLIVNKAIKLEDVLVPDKNAIFIGVRRLAYGDDYHVKITCPSCSEQNVVTIDLSALENKPFDFDKCTKNQNQFSFTLPSGMPVTYKLLNQVDEHSIEAEIKNLAKVSKEASKELTTRLCYLITSVNNNPDKAIIRKFVNDELTAKDSLALRKHVRDNNPDIDMSFQFVCSECQHERRLDVPIGASFLWPDLDA
jgi:hypothetical protein